MPYKSYSPKQKKLAAVAAPRKKITSADFTKLRTQSSKKDANMYHSKKKNTTMAMTAKKKPTVKKAAMAKKKPTMKKRKMA